MLNPCLLLVLLPGALAAAQCGLGPFLAKQPHEPQSKKRLRSVHDPLIWLQKLDPAEVQRVDPDLLVIDYSVSGEEAGERSPLEIESLRRRPDGSKRIVLAYLSIGEAEDYRFYWKQVRQVPDLVGPKNPKWPGNYRVRYWKPEWWHVIFQGEGSYVERILYQGFDGLFLDTVDAAEWWEDFGVEDAASRMAELVTAIATFARARRPDFIVVAQNPFRILDFPGIVSILDGISCEAHLFQHGRPVPKARWEGIVRQLREIQLRNLAVLVIEYPANAAQANRLFQMCAKEGFVCFAGPKLLDGPGIFLERRPQ